MSEAPIISDELNSLLDVEFGPEVYQIDGSMVRKFAEAIGDPSPRWRSTAPPTFAAALRLEKLFDRMFTAESPLKRVLNAASELEYRQLINVGDVISVTGRLSRLRKREGQDGSMLFMIFEMTYKNQRGEVVATGRNTIIRH